MNSILDAHGGMGRSQRYEKVEATTATGDGFFALEGFETFRRSAATAMIDSQLGAARDRPAPRAGSEP
jgi:hypothetical protein